MKYVEIQTRYSMRGREDFCKMRNQIVGDFISNPHLVQSPIADLLSVFHPQRSLRVTIDRSFFRAVICFFLRTNQQVAYHINLLFNIEGFYELLTGARKNSLTLLR